MAKKSNIENVYGLSPMQEGMLFHSLMEEQPGVYVEQAIIELGGSIDPVVFEETYRRLIARHDVFRTVFVYRTTQQPRQVVMKHIEPDFHSRDITSMTEEEQGDFLAHFSREDRVKRFDLTHGPLSRISLFKRAPDRWCLVWSYHHILMDGWCLGILYRELVQIYTALKDQSPIGLEPVTPYAGYIDWLENRDKQGGPGYWREYLAGYEQAAVLPKMKHRGGEGESKQAEGAYKLNEYFLTIDETTARQVEAAARENQATINTLFQVLWGILLQRYTDSQDVVFGVVVSGRHPEIKGIDRMVGLFINTVPVRVRMRGEETFAQLLASVQKETAFSKFHEYLPLAEIQANSPLKRNLIDHIMAFENYPIRDQIKQAGDNGTQALPFHFLKMDAHEQTNYDLAVTIGPGTFILVKFSYNELAYSAHFIEDAGNRLKEIILQVVRNPHIPVRSIQLITEAEKRQILAEFNDSAAGYPRDRSIHQLFEEQVMRTPENIAVVGSGSVTYAELNREANQVAHALQEKGVLPDSIIGIMMERSVEMIIGILGILKAGGAYLPIDPEYPRERVDYMLKDSGAKILLTKLPEGRLIHDSLNRFITYHPGNLAYIIYTSGSTGMAKGCMIEHRHVVRLMVNDRFPFDFNDNDVWTLFHSYCFDFSVWEIWGALVYGGRLIIVPRMTARDPTQFLGLLEKEKVTVLNQTPGAFYHLSDEVLSKGGNGLAVRYVIFGGEALAPARLKGWQGNYPHTRLINMYGITETTVHVTFKEITAREIRLDESNIGKPIPTLSTYIVDRYLNLQPVGMAGELIVGGDGAARGYLNRPELTAERFLVCYRSYRTYRTYFSSKKIYRTGDLGRWLPGGDMEYLGRIDDQVKIRGYRIELGEIEYYLRMHPEIKEVVVINRSERERHDLCAYFTVRLSPVDGEGEKRLSVPGLKRYLAGKLPGYMIPAFFVQVDEIPLSANGKVDRKALPEPDFRRADPGYLPPGDTHEKRLAEIWQEVLGVERVGIEDNFFEIGGDSIKAIQVSARLKKYELDLKVGDLFTNPTIKELGKCIKETRGIIDQETVTGKVELTPIQHWFFEANFIDSHHFNQAVMLFRKDGFDEEIVKKVMNEIAVHHDVLRMVYAREPHGPVTQMNRGIEGNLFDFEAFRFAGGEQVEKRIEAESTRIQAGIKLETGPLVKLGLFKTAEGDHLLWAIHHLVVDGISWRILLEDFHTGYKQCQGGESIKFQDKTHSFKYWAEKLNEYAVGKGIRKELAYWKSVEAELVGPLAVGPGKPPDKEKKKMKYRGMVGVTLNKEETRKLLKKVNWAFNTEINDILLTALGMAIKEWSGRNKIKINLEGHGRESISEGVDISRTVGWFTGQYPVILDMTRWREDYSYFIKSVKETLRCIPNKGIGYGILRYLTPAQQKEGLRFNTETEIAFNYLGEFAETGNIEMSRLGTGEVCSSEMEGAHSLEINGFAADGRLSMSFVYNRYEYEKNQVEQLAELYRSALIKLIHYCAGREKKEYTPSDLGYNRISPEDFAGLVEYVGRKTREEPEIRYIYPLSPMQKGMLYHSLTGEGSLAYFEQSVMTLKGDIDKDILQESFGKFIARNDILRTVFCVERLDEPLQVVLKQRNFQIYYEDISGLGEEDRARYMEEFKRKDREKGFDLTGEIPVRISLFKYDPHSYGLVWSFHHILMDGWCLGILYRELVHIYYALEHGGPIELGAAVPYSRYIRWLENQDKQEGFEYWKDYLAGYERLAGLPRIKPPGSKAGLEQGKGAYRLNEYFLTLDETLTRQIETTARQSQVTVNTVFRALWGVLLQRYIDTPDVVFGAVVSGRPPEIEGIEQMVGLFINTVPVRVKVQGEENFLQLLASVQQEASDSKPYEYLPLAEIQANSPLKRNLLDHILVFENYPLQEEIKHIEDTASHVPLFYVTGMEMFEQTNYDLNVIIVPGKNILVKFNYNELVYDKGFIGNVGAQFIQIMRQVTAAPGIAISAVELITEAEKRQVLEEFNRTTAEYPTDKTIHELFEEQVERTPENVAVVGSGSVTYAELNREADQVAHVLKERGVLTDNIVGIMMERSVEIITGIMGILKAGGAYLPIDPDYPQKRIDYMLKDSGAKLLITSNNLEAPGFPLLPATGSRQPATSLAYVIYTSGTTGRPKGTLVEHRSLVNLCYWHNRYYSVTEKDRAAQYANFVFDASVWEIFPYLIVGASLHIIRDDMKTDIHRLGDYYRKHRITISFLPTPFCRQFMEEFRNIGTLRVLLTGGDKLNFFVETGYRLYNNYGPTENTVVTTACPVDAYNENIPIGRPVANNFIFVLSRCFQMQPVGAAGELYIGGDSLGRGYLNNPELTGEKFINYKLQITNYKQITNHKLQITNKSETFPINKKFYGGPGGISARFSKEPPGRRRLYNTGDLARWLADGNIQFLGRVDEQVKIRGFRIELGEIESLLMENEIVKEAAAAVKTDKNGERYLCAYVVLTGDGSRLKSDLQRLLPHFMVPSYFIPMEKLPLTFSGKVDRKALPEPDFDWKSEGYLPPRNVVEEKMAEVWQEVLGIERIGIGDNFFEIGGDSIKAIQVSARLKRYNLDLKVSDLFSNPTIKELNKCIRETRRVIDQGTVQGKVELTPIQHWFFQSKFTDSHHFNQAVVLFRKDGFDEEIVKKVMNEIAVHHDALRMVYVRGGHAPVTQVNRGQEWHLFDFEVIRFESGEQIEKRIEAESSRVQGGIDLEKGPLVKLGLFKTAEGDHLLWAIHHLVVDGISWRILLEDFGVGYKQCQDGESIKFQAKTHSFKYWAEKLNEYAAGKDIRKELEYWKNVEVELIEPLAVGRKRGLDKEKKKVKYRDNVGVTLNKEETRELLKKVNRAFNTEINDILLTALGMAVKEWSGRDKININLESHGREAIIEDVDISRTVGWFTGRYPVILDMTRWREDYSYFIKSVKETLRRIPNKGIGYGILRYLTPARQKEGLRFNTEPEIVFNYLGEFAETGNIEMSRLGTGEVCSPEMEGTHSLEINGFAADGQLSISFNYNRYEYERNQVERLAGLYRTALIKLIHYCAGRKKKEYTPSDLGYNKISLEDFSGLVEYVSRRVGEEPGIQYIYPLSPMQRGMLYHALTDKGSHAYFQQSVLTLKGDIDKDMLQDSFRVLVDRHDILRTVFCVDQTDEPLQVVLKHRDFHIYYEDISGQGEEEQARYVEEFKLNDRERGFDLTGGILVRVSLFKYGSHSHGLVWSFHHILMDGWCLGILYREVVRIYYALKHGRSIDLEPAAPYFDYIKWLEILDKQEGLGYWEEYLAGYEQLAALPGLRPLGSEAGVQHDKRGYQLREHFLTIDEPLTRQIAAMARESQVTINTVFQAVWGVLLQRYANTTDVVFGAVVSGRPPEIGGIEQMMGLFINTVPVRIKVQGEENFLQLLVSVRQEASASTSYEYLPLAEIQSVSPLKGNLLDHIIVFENYPLQEEIKHIEDTVSHAPLFYVIGMEIFEQTNYDLNVIIVPGKSIVIKFSYNGFVYDNGFTANVGAQLRHIMQQVVSNPHIPIRSIELITEAEKKEVLEEFNRTTGEYPADKTLHELFHEQVERTPQKIAVVGEGLVTYAELNRKADQVAHALQEKGVLPDDIVAIIMERSVEIITGIMGILKAGGAYLPIDPDYPQERIDYMLKDSGAKILLTNLPEGRHFHHSSNRFIDRHSDHLVYVIYTSGSTGRPKGVTLKHKNLVNLLYYEYTRTAVDFSQRVAQFATISFDASAQEIFSTLLAGGTLCIVDKDSKHDIRQFFEFIRKNCIHILFLPTAFLKFLFSDPGYAEKFPGSLAHIITAGEQLIISRYLKKYLVRNRVSLHNHYGPSETHVVTALPMPPVPGEIHEIPTIGKPISNTRIYILDKSRNLQPMGAAGELVVGGDSVGRGYLNRPELTAERFVSGCYRSYRTYRTYISSEIIYKTGDLARWLPDGNIEFLGRIDSQVKIRGFRVEPGEIENHLLNHENIREAVVLDKEDSTGDKYLCAYVVPVPGKDPDAIDLRGYLSGVLPDYMIPSYFVKLERLLLTPSGKVDRKSLPVPRLSVEEEYTAPENPTEEKLVEIWGDILGISGQRISTAASFFMLGGQSLKAVNLAARIHRELGVEIAVTKLFKTPTIKGIARYIRGSTKATFTFIEPAEEKEYYSLSPAQKRLYILQQMAPAATAYNMPGAFELEGLPDKEKLQETFTRLIKRHEILRTSFEIINDEPAQRIHEENYKLQITNYKQITNSKLQIPDIIKNFIQSFDLSHVPLLRLGLIKVDDEKYILILDMHHIIRDGISMDIFVREAMAFYAGESLPPLKIRYRDYSEWQGSEAQKQALKRQEQYWIRQFAGEIPVLDLPLDFSRPSVRSFAGGFFNFGLENKDSKSLNEFALKEGITLYMVLLAIYNILLSKLSRREEIVVGTPTAGRRHTDLQQIIGMFVNTLALKNSPAGSRTFTGFLQEIKSRTLEAFENQDYPFEDLVEHVSPDRDTSRNPLFDTMFALQNVERFKIEIPGLRLSPYNFEYNVSKFDLTLQVIDMRENIYFTFEYCTKLFKEETIERFAGYFKRVISQVLERPGQQIQEIEIISEKEKKQILFDFNDTAADYPADKTIHQLFEEQAARIPDTVSAVGKKEKMHITYSVLNEKSDQVAHTLGKKGVLTDNIVGIMMERSVEIIIGILGILKAGGAYLPIDPDYPQERIDYMLKDSGAKLLVTTNNLEAPGFLFLPATGNRQPATSLAYVIYTSGSTGRPKGVMIEHAALVNFVYSMYHNYEDDFGPRDNCLSLTNICFDVSVSEFFLPLSFGSTVVFLPRYGLYDVGELARVLVEEAITFTYIPPGLLTEVIRVLRTYGSGVILNKLLVGVEPIKDYVLEDYAALNPSMLIINGYGPTETTICATAYRYHSHVSEGYNVPIGGPLANTRILLLDAGNCIVPVGTAGELCIAGDGLGRGYLNRPELTAERFINQGLFLKKPPLDPAKTFDKKAILTRNTNTNTNTLYRTGDLARWLADGNLEFLGRRDQQVKIRGYRIEPGEIENRLLQFEWIKEVVVTPVEDKKNLCAYVVPISTFEGELDIDALKTGLSVHLPEYMIPAYFVRMDRLPLTPSGKTDRRALPLPERKSADSVVEAPRNEIEEKMVELWAEVLGIKKELIGVNENFFKLGGHSLKAAMLAAKIFKVFNVKVPLMKIFETPTVEGICSLISLSEWIWEQEKEKEFNVEEEEEVIL